MFPSHVHRYIFLFGLVGLAFGMMMGTVPTSVPQIILASNYVLEGGFRKKIRLLRSSRLFWVLSAIYLIHVAGVFYSKDVDAALHDIRTKMPLMFLPLLLLSTGPLTKKEFTGVLYCFIGGCVLNVAWCHVYTFLLHRNEVVRNASRFMSHIRLGLYLNLAIAACLCFSFQARSRFTRLLWLVLPVFFLASMVALGLASGLVNFLLLAGLFSVILIFRQRGAVRIAAVSALVVLAAGTAIYLRQVAGAQLAAKKGPQNRMQSHSAAGNAYVHLDTLGQKENGNYVLINIQSQELQRVWNREFPEDSFSYSPEHNLQRFDVLVRYMASKGLYKDSAGFMKLSASDKENIRRNYTNHLQPGWNFLRRRSYELVNEYDEFINRRAINGHSFTMRLYFWKAALYAIGRRPLFGFGTGDVQEAMDLSYEETGSPLEAAWRLRPHNQFLTVTVALGIAGLIVFLFALVYPVIRLGGSVHVLYWPFLFLALVSFLFEDTLETQAGLTFFAFFNALFLCQAGFREEGIPGDSRECR